MPKCVKHLRTVLVLSLVVVLVGACLDRAADITYVNETGENLRFYVQTDEHDGLLSSRSVMAGTSVKHSVFRARYTWLRVAATI